jgi:hypothetical protein
MWLEEKSFIKMKLFSSFENGFKFLGNCETKYVSAIWTRHNMEPQVGQYPS